jgi:aerobic-type carbon monoxide dehydrogenase small subunit (CoxS/CutS family)
MAISEESMTEDNSRPSTQTEPETSASPSNAQPSSGISRRGFLKGAGITAAGTALLEGMQVLSREAAAAVTPDVHEFGPGAVAVTLRINGKEHALQIEPRTTLAEALRMHLGLTGTKIICDRGSCSGCTVLLDRTPVNSCSLLAMDAVGHSVTTIEGISTEDTLHPVQAAFVKHDALQCGFCTPGMVMSCTALLERNPKPTEAEVRKALSGNRCRCGTYPKIFAAMHETAEQNAHSA